MLNLIHRQWLPFSVGALLLITVGSLMPLAELPAVPGSDKTHHFLAYGCLALPIALRRHRLWVTLIVGALLWSGAIELIQPQVNRYAEWLDLFANGVGLALGTLLGIWLRKFVTR